MRNRSNVKGLNPHRGQPFSRHVLTCHLYGKVDHIRSERCFLRYRTPKKMTTPPRSDMENLVFIMRDVVLRLDKLEGVKRPT